LVNTNIKVSYSTKDTIGEMGIGIGRLKWLPFTFYGSDDHPINVMRLEGVWQHEDDQKAGEMGLGIWPSGQRDRC